jgi:cytoskeletal protein CcmA (bactofilin family)
MATNAYRTIAVPPAPDRSAPNTPSSTALTAIGPSIRVTGVVTASEHLIIDGEVDGEIVLPDHGVAINGSGWVRGEICARTITVLGRADGRLTASALIELRATAVVTGRLSSPRLSIEDGARFQGTADPTKTDTAMAVARHRLTPGEAAEAPALTAAAAPGT